MPKDRLEVWLALWGQSLPTAARGRPPTSADWQCAVERFIAALKADLTRLNADKEAAKVIEHEPDTHATDSPL